MSSVANSHFPFEKLLTCWLEAHQLMVGHHVIMQPKLLLVN